MTKQTVIATLAKFGLRLDRFNSVKAGNYRLQLGKRTVRVQRRAVDGGKWRIVYTAYFGMLQVREHDQKGQQFGPFQRWGERNRIAWVNLDSLAANK